MNGAKEDAITALMPYQGIWIGTKISGYDAHTENALITN